MTDDFPECSRCHETYMIRFDHVPSDHGMCWPCASEELDKANAELEELRSVLSWFVAQFPCPQIHASVITNKPGRCPEDSDDPEEWCASAKFQRALGSSKMDPRPPTT